MAFYHVKIEKIKKLKTEKQNPIYGYNYSEERIINEIITPYKNGEEFIVDGYNLNKDAIDRLKIVTTDEDVSVLAGRKTKEWNTSGILGFWKKSDIVDSDNYTKDVTVEMLSSVKNISQRQKTNVSSTNRDVFIVHGHDDLLRMDTELFLKSIECNPIVLFKEPNGGSTVIEKIEEYTGKAAFALILYTYCDQGYPKEQPNLCKPRARQNVIFEHGYLTAKLGREKVVVLLKDDVEIPSDINGIAYIKVDDTGTWKYNVSKEMKKAGMKIDLNKI